MATSSTVCDWALVLPAPSPEAISCENRQGFGDIADKCLVIKSPTTEFSVEKKPSSETERSIAIDEVVIAGSVARLMVRLVPSWTVSLVVHVIALVSLALFGHITGMGSAISLTIENIDDTPLEQLEVDLSESSASAAPKNEFNADRIEQTVKLEMLVVDSEGALAKFTQPELLSNLADIYQMPDGEGLSGLLPLADGDTGVDENGKGNRAQFFGVSATGIKFVFIIDCSGSMGGARWNSARNELIRSLRNLTEEQVFCVLLYSSEAWSYNGSVKKADFMSATPENLDLTTRWLNQQAPGGGTLPLNAVKEALQLDPDAVFLLSDGELQDDSRGYLWRSNGKKGKDEAVPVHTISAGMGYGAELLRVIALENGGNFQQVW